MAPRYLILATIAVVLIVGSGLAVGLGTSDSSDPVAGVPVASIDALREAGVLYLQEHQVFLVHNNGDPLALSDDPQHLKGEHTEWCETSQMFETPTHGEMFDRRGNYYAGPARRGLDRFPVRVVGERVYVDLDQRIRGPERSGPPASEPEGPFCITN